MLLFTHAKWSSNWGRVTHTHICVNKLTFLVQTIRVACRLAIAKPFIIFNNAGILLIELVETDFIGTLIEINSFSFKKMHSKMLSGKWPLLVQTIACRLAIAKPFIFLNNAGILLIELVETDFIGTLIEINSFSSKKMHSKMLSGKWRPFCLGLNVLIQFK